MKIPIVSILAVTALATAARADDPRTNSWLTTYAGRYVRVYTNDAMKAAGTTLTTWGNAQLSQSLPVYCGVQEIYSSTDWVYIRSTGLGSHVMGPWFNNAAHTALFVNIPVNQKMNYRIPRTPTVPVTKSRAQGEIGMFADGVRIFDAGEIANASNALLQLDENGDGQLTGEELRPPGPFPGGPPPGEFGNPPPPPPW